LSQKLFTAGAGTVKHTPSRMVKNLWEKPVSLGFPAIAAGE
jgi:hypothetical protein